MPNFCSYDDIQHLNAEQKAAIIQQAKYEAYTTLNLGSRGILFFIISLVLGAASILILPRFLSATVASITSIAVFVMSYQALTRSITEKGLKSLLARQAISTSL